ncbi:MAG: hypothetical protein MUE56_07270 [Ignavibacteria bacterium]|jgi:hypothetical protein|nr:hypothetical protein [Ignavibacteria bacterium]
MINNRTRILIYVILIISLFVIINGKIPVVGRNFLYEEKVFSDGKKRMLGDLYRFCRVEYFREEFPYVDNPGSKFMPDSADIFVFGDSFFNTMMDTVNVPMAIRNITGKEVFNSLDYNGIVFNNPLGFYKKFKIKAKHRRILILESAERYSYISALKSYLKESENYDFFYYKSIIKRNIMLGDTEYWLSNSVFTEKLINFKSGFYFNNFGIIAPEISDYSVSPKFLFFSEEVNFNKMPKPEEEINRISDNVNKLAEILDRDYNMSLIYMIIPNKFTIYGQYADSEYVYDNYIPEVYSRLNANTNAINLHEIYSKIKEDNPADYLYFSSDTHFNLRGREIAINEIIKKINKIYKEKQDAGK